MVTETGPKALELVEARYVAPGNALPGLYVSLRGDRESLMGEAALSLAEDVAREKGWDPDGSGDIGYPVRYNARLLTRAYWFYKRLTPGQS